MSAFKKRKELKDELKSLNIYYINGDFIYSETAENLPASYEEYKENKDQYPNVDDYLSMELNSMLPQPEKIERNGYVNNLAQKPRKPDIPETIIKQSGELIVKDEDVPERLKAAGYHLDRGNIILKIIKDNGEYKITTYDNNRHTATLLGGHDSKSRTILMNDVTICLDGNLEKEIRKLKSEQQAEELKKIYKLAQNSRAIQSGLERMCTFVHEATHADNYLNEILANNEQIKATGTNVKRSLSETGHLNRHDEVSAVFNALKYEIKHYNENGKPQDISQYSDYFKSFLQECNKLPAEEREKHFNSPKEQLIFINNAWSEQQGALYVSNANSQILEQIAYRSKYFCAFDIQPNPEAYKESMRRYVPLRGEAEKTDLSEYLNASTVELSYIESQSFICSQTVKYRINRLNAAEITETTRKKMIELHKLENQNNNLVQKMILAKSSHQKK